MLETQRYADGRAFYKCGGLNEKLRPEQGENHREWLAGFCQAMAEYDPSQEEPTLQAALLDRGICSELLEELLLAAENALARGLPDRWPAVPVRGWGRRLGGWAA
jgi:hypothetical protein